MVLTGFDAAQKIKVIKVIREVMGLGLAEAKAAVEGAPTTMKEAPVQGGRRGSEEAGRGSRRQGRAEVSFTLNEKMLQALRLQHFFALFGDSGG